MGAVVVLEEAGDGPLLPPGAQLLQVKDFLAAPQQHLPQALTHRPVEVEVAALVQQTRDQTCLGMAELALCPQSMAHPYIGLAAAAVGPNQAQRLPRQETEGLVAVAAVPYIQPPPAHRVLEVVLP